MITVFKLDNQEWANNMIAPQTHPQPTDPSRSIWIHYSIAQCYKTTHTLIISTCKSSCFLDLTSGQVLSDFSRK